MPNLPLIALLAASTLTRAAPPQPVVAEPAKVSVAPGESTAWKATLDRVVPGVVSLTVTAVRDFDTESAGISQGTGFVVDAEKGLILTNRHMVHAGPVLAEAVLLDNEEIELQPVYRDPVHDFGFYRFDPSTVRHMRLPELTLDPAAAFVGQEIRVVGNDAGEKVSILDGTLARLDRNAPDYGPNTYNDFNTFYLQAASNTSGGSSGSPVINVEGKVIALNAGGRTGAASSFYLPLDRVVRALERLRADEPVPRGTLQATFVHTHFDELRRLGLRAETELAARQAPGHRSGMLVVSEVVPGGPGVDALRVGDVLVRIDDQLVTEFVPLEAILDSSVGETVEVEIERGGKSITSRVTVQDLHAITPDDYLEVGRAVLHELSYTQARNHHRPVAGVYLAVAGYMFAAADIPSGTVITHVDSVPVPTLDAMEAALESKAQGQRIRVRFHGVNDPRHAYEAVAVMDRTWYPLQRCRRDDASGRWPCVESPPPPGAPPERPGSALLATPASNPAEAAIAPSLVMVDFDIPHPTTGVKDFNYVGVGTIIDVQQGLVVVDRDTVPVNLGDMMLTFAGSVRVPGRIRYLHPVHNFAVVQYDPALLGDLAVREVTWATRELSVGDEVWQVGLDGAHEVVSRKTEVAAHEPLELGASGTPRFRDANVDVIDLDGAEPSLGGVITDRKGRVHALWASFLDQRDGDRAFHGLPSAFLQPVIEPLRLRRTPGYHTLGFELVPLNLADARERGLSDARIRQILKHDPDNRHVLEVRMIHSGSGAARLLRDTDLLLAIDGEPVTRMREVEALHNRDRVRVTVLRDGAELTEDVPTLPVDGAGVDQVLSWAGMILHSPHYEVAAQQGIGADGTSDGVYIAWLWFGSPAHRYELRPTRRITRVDDVPTPDLGAFQAAIQGKRDGESVRITMEALDGTVWVNTLKLDLQYWPTLLYESRDGVWTRAEPSTLGRAPEVPGG